MFENLRAIQTIHRQGRKSEDVRDYIGTTVTFTQKYGKYVHAGESGKITAVHGDNISVELEDGTRVNLMHGDIPKYLDLGASNNAQARG